MMTNIKGLYIHIPFCDKVCSYCDFFKIKTNTLNHQNYIDYLLKEIEMQKDYFKNIETIYIGGGTPSSLSLKLLEKLLESINKHIDFKNIKEFTIEANPNDITSEFIQLIKHYNVNRLSLGIQSFDDESLKIYRRSHNKNQAIEALKLLNNNNFENISIDLIYGLTKDNLEKITEDIKIAYQFNVKHFSIYSLIIEPNTILYQKQQRNEFKRLDENSEALLYSNMVGFLESLGYMQYEISNFALDNYQSKHNLIYWNYEEFIGLGASASSYYHQTRFKNIDNLLLYYEGINNQNLNYIEKIELTQDELLFEEVMMNLRKVTGLNIKSFKEKYNISIFDAFPNVQNLINDELLINKNDYLYIPKNKLFLQNAILLALM